MTSRREISRNYKERTLHGGIYTITNTLNGKYLIGHAADLASARNRFQFAVMTNNAPDYRLRDDWAASGAQAFTFAVLEELEQKPDQSQADFMADLNTLEDLWRANLDPTNAY